MKAQDFYYYPMILSQKEDVYEVAFPDFKDCEAQGESIAEAIKNGKEALSIHLYELLKAKKDIPEASDLKDITLNKEEMIVYADINMKLFKHSYDNKSVTRAITLPRYLNEMVKDSDMNVSAVVQQSIKEYLGIKED